MNEGIVSAELGLGGWPAVAEESIIARDVLLAATPAGLVRAVFEDHADAATLRELAGGRRGGKAARGHLADATAFIAAYFADETAPLVDIYGQRGLLVRVDGRGPVDLVAGRVVAALDAAHAGRAES